MISYADEIAANYREDPSYHDPEPDTREYCYYCGEVIDPDAPDTMMTGKHLDEYAHAGCVDSYKESE